MGRHLSGKSKKQLALANKLNQSNSEQLLKSQQSGSSSPKANTTEETKKANKIRKRLYHEFRNMINDEWSFCRSSQASATSHVHDILTNGLETIPGAGSSQKNK